MTCLLFLSGGIAKDAELAYQAASWSEKKSKRFDFHLTLQVELHRTKSQCLNKLVYAWQGGS